MVFCLFEEANPFVRNNPQQHQQHYFIFHDVAALTLSLLLINIAISLNVIASIQLEPIIITTVNQLLIITVKTSDAFSPDNISIQA